METHKEAVSVLIKEYYKVGGKLFGEVFARQRADEETKKSISSMDLLNALMTGKGIKTEWKLEESEDFKKFAALAHSINFLATQKENEAEHNNTESNGQ